MCFSASANFIAGTSLLAVGAVTLSKAARKAELPFAMIPLLFGIQQIIEGVIWLGFRFDAPLPNALMAQVYSLFSHVLWPIYMPFAVLLLEPVPWRRKTLSAFLWVGAATGLYLFYILVRFPIRAEAVGGHILYVSPHYYVPVVMGGYLAATCISLFFSSHKVVVTFGVVALLSFVAAYGFYTLWFISVWCFFAAILSGVIYLYFRKRSHSRLVTA
ncbi:MAG: hypothetical protein HYX64_11450 [Gammaproteobacteria bacterium]|jgi:hypothetical protein|nr:hypothetical protein [Gammaproteobacteria bacterium]